MSNQSWIRVAPLLLAAGVVLAGPFIRDNGLRALWMMLGLISVMFCVRAIRRTPGAKRTD